MCGVHTLVSYTQVHTHIHTHTVLSRISSLHKVRRLSLHVAGWIQHPKFKQGQGVSGRAPQDGGGVDQAQEGGPGQRSGTQGQTVGSTSFWSFLSFFFFFNVYFSEKEREKGRVLALWGGGAEREGDTESEAGSRL